MIDTKQKILDTAEFLFGQNGYDATSLRQIIAEAGVNLAAIHYHFGSKQELLDEVILRKASPVNEERIIRLERLLAEAGTGPLRLEDVLEAFLDPMTATADQNPQFVRLMGRMYAEGLLPALVQRTFGPILARFFQAMQRALPDLSREEFLWRVHFMTGALAHTMTGQPDVVAVEPEGFRSRMDRLVPFLCGGFRAAASQPRASQSIKVEVE